MIRYLLLCLGLVLVFSCAPKQTKLILLPQDNGEIGAVTLNTGKETMILNKPYTSSQSGKSGVEKVNPELIDKTYGQLFKAEVKRPIPPPPKPAKSPLPTQFSLYFESNSMGLTQESKTQLPSIMIHIRNNPPNKIRVIGYLHDDIEINPRLLMIMPYYNSINIMLGFKVDCNMLDEWPKLNVTAVPAIGASCKS